MFSGIYSPSVTLIDSNGQIDLRAMENHVTRLIDAGIDGILFFGSIGEFFSFSVEEKEKFLKFIVPKIAGAVKVLAGVGAASLDEVLDNVAAAEEAKVDGVVALPPFYFEHSRGRALEFYSQVSAASRLPIMLYNFPERTGADLDPQLVTELAKRHENIVGIKDTVDNQSHARRIIREVKSVRSDFSVLSGFDEYYLGNRICGGDGVLSGLTNLVPHIFVKMHRAYESGDLITCHEALSKITHLAEVYEIGDLFIAAIKEGVLLSGVPCLSDMKAPAVELTAVQKQQIATLLGDI